MIASGSLRIRRCRPVGIGIAREGLRSHLDAAKADQRVWVGGTSKARIGPFLETHRALGSGSRHGVVASTEMDAGVGHAEAHPADARAVMTLDHRTIHRP